MEELPDWIFQRTGKTNFLRKGFFLLNWILGLGVSSDLQPGALVQTVCVPLSLIQT